MCPPRFHRKHVVRTHRFVVQVLGPAVQERALPDRGGDVARHVIVEKRVQLVRSAVAVARLVRLLLRVRRRMLRVRLRRRFLRVRGHQLACRGKHKNTVRKRDQHADFNNVAIRTGIRSGASFRYSPTPLAPRHRIRAVFRESVHVKRLIEYPSTKSV